MFYVNFNFSLSKRIWRKFKVSGIKWLWCPIFVFVRICVFVRKESTFYQLIILHFFNLQEKYWLQNSNEIISIVKSRLTVVEGHHSVGTEQQPSLFNLITKIKTNVLHLFAMLNDMQSESQQSNQFIDVQSTDADEVNRSSTERNNESSNSLKEVGKSESSYRVEISKIFNGRHDQIMDFVWLYECTLLLQHESHNYCRICSYITPSKKMREL